MALLLSNQIRILVDTETGEQIVVEGSPGSPDTYTVLGPLTGSSILRDRKGDEVEVHADGKLHVYTPPAALDAKVADDTVELLASAARSTVTSGAYGAAIRLPQSMRGCLFVCDLTAAATDVGDTLNVFIQTRIGNLWVDVVHFTELLGNGGAKRFYSKITAAITTAEFENGAALGAAAVRHLFGDEWRVMWALVDGDANASFTFSVGACPM